MSQQAPLDIFIERLREKNIKLCFIFDLDLRPIKTHEIPDDLGHMGVCYFEDEGKFKKILWVIREENVDYVELNVGYNELEMFLSPNFFPLIDSGKRPLRLKEILKGEV